MGQHASDGPTRRMPHVRIPHPDNHRFYALLVFAFLVIALIGGMILELAK